MSQNYILVLLSLLSTQIAMGQEPSNRTEVDTIEVYSDRILVDFKTFTGSNFTEQGQAFLYPVILKARKSKWLPGFVKKTMPADSMVLHGIVKSQWEYGKYRIGLYDQGQKIEVTYYNAADTEISLQEFYGNLRNHSDPEKGTGSYILHEKKRRKAPYND